jgi:epoxide hydrolase-like predicted phosphatase
MEQPQFRGIIFDFSSVFTRIGRRARILRECEAELRLPRNELTNLLFAGEAWWAVSTGRITAEEYWQQVVQALGGQTLPAVLEPFQHNPFAYEELNHRMIALARRLHKSYRTALLSNATLYLDTLLVDHELTDIFDVIVNSARVGLRKPDPQIYRLTLDRIGLAPAQCLFVDDKERNTLVAQTLGMEAIVFRSAADLLRKLGTIRVQVA